MLCSRLNPVVSIILVHKRLFRLRILKPIHFAQGIETPNPKYALTPFISFV
jgi:hypothetical protein